MKLLFCFIIFINIFIFHQVWTATIDDARQALEELDFLSLTLQGNLHLHMNAQADIIRNQLVQMQDEISQEIIDQIGNISSKINFLVENTKNTTGTNVESCVRTAHSDLQDFSSELNDRMWECYGNMIMTANNMLYSTWNRVWADYDISYECSRMSYVQCATYENATCANSVLNNIDNAGIQMKRVNDVLARDMANQLTAMNFPCRQMIAQELALYPTLILNFVSSCVKTVTFSDFAIRC